LTEDEFARASAFPVHGQLQQDIQLAQPYREIQVWRNETRPHQALVHLAPGEFSRQYRLGPTVEGGKNRTWHCSLSRKPKQFCWALSLAVDRVGAKQVLLGADR